jgi:hypothetical protein
LTLSVTNGTLNLSSTSGVSVTGNGSASVTVTGTVANLQTAVSSLTYTPTTGYSGSDSLKIALSDPGDSLSSSTSVGLTISSASAPKITAPASESFPENNSLEFNAQSISITDTNAGSSSEQLMLSATHGTLRLGSSTGITFVSGANRSASMTISGTLTRLNAALNNLIYTPTTNYTGSASISLSYTDGGDKLSASATINLTITSRGRSRGGLGAFGGNRDSSVLQTQPLRQSVLNLNPLNSAPSSFVTGFETDGNRSGSTPTSGSASHGVQTDSFFVNSGGTVHNSDQTPHTATAESGSCNGGEESADNLTALWEGFRSALSILGG